MTVNFTLNFLTVYSDPLVWSGNVEPWKMLTFKATCLIHMLCLTCVTQPILHSNLSRMRSMHSEVRVLSLASWVILVTGLWAPREDVVFTRPTTRPGTERAHLMQYLQWLNRNINFCLCLCAFAPGQADKANVSYVTTMENNLWTVSINKTNFFKLLEPRDLGTI